ncbi:MAG: hypothetical protein EOO16_00265 [Chitinophagaceae bacterium]|nr:MAG: hypothetical protein EOO16_00265 [Chitinophagaceae bacterium]
MKTYIIAGLLLMVAACRKSDIISNEPGGKDKPSITTFTRTAGPYGPTLHLGLNVGTAKPYDRNFLVEWFFDSTTQWTVRHLVTLPANQMCVEADTYWNYDRQLPVKQKITYKELRQPCYGEGGAGILLLDKKQDGWEFDFIPARNYPGENVYVIYFTLENLKGSFRYELIGDSYRTKIVMPEGYRFPEKPVITWGEFGKIEDYPPEETK